MTTPTVQPLYASYSAFTITLASLATSSTFIAGREATALANNSSLYADYELNGVITVGSSPTANTQILIFGVVALTDSPTWPDTFTGSDAAVTLTSVALGQGFLRPLATINVPATTSNVGYPFFCPSVGARLGYRTLMGRNWSIYVTHNTAVNLNATGGNHVIRARGLNPQIPSI